MLITWEYWFNSNKNWEKATDISFPMLPFLWQLADSSLWYRRLRGRVDGADQKFSMHTLTCDFSALRPVPLGPFSREPAHILKNWWSVISENGKNASTRTRTEILQLTRLIALPLSYWGLGPTHEPEDILTISLQLRVRHTDATLAFSASPTGPPRSDP